MPDLSGVCFRQCRAGAWPATRSPGKRAGAIAAKDCERPWVRPRPRPRSTRSCSRTGRILARAAPPTHKRQEPGGGEGSGGGNGAPASLARPSSAAKSPSGLPLRLALAPDQSVSTDAAETELGDQVVAGKRPLALVVACGVVPVAHAFPARLGSKTWIFDALRMHAGGRKLVHDIASVPRPNAAGDPCVAGLARSLYDFHEKKKREAGQARLRRIIATRELARWLSAPGRVRPRASGFPSTRRRPRNRAG